MTKKCEKCGGKISLLQTTALWNMDSMKQIEKYQPYRCKRCGFEGRIELRKSKRLLRIGDFL